MYGNKICGSSRNYLIVPVLLDTKYVLKSVGNVPMLFSYSASKIVVHCTSIALFLHRVKSTFVLGGEPVLYPQAQQNRQRNIVVRKVQSVPFVKCQRNKMAEGCRER